jgi:hypothetical protein
MYVCMCMHNAQFILTWPTHVLPFSKGFVAFKSGLGVVKFSRPRANANSKTFPVCTTHRKRTPVLL